MSQERSIRSTFESWCNWRWWKLLVQGNKLRGYIVSRSSWIFLYDCMRYITNWSVSIWVWIKASKQHDYLTTTQMEISGTWQTEVEVIALGTLLKTTIAIYYHPPGAKVHFSFVLWCWHINMHLFSQYLETILTVSRLSQVACNFPSCNQYVPSCFLVVHYLSFTRSALH